MIKCFEAIEEIIFDEQEIITTMISPEGERIEMICTVNPHEEEKEGNVEIWMKDIEDVMRSTLKDIL